MSKADEMLMEIFNIREEKFKKGELEVIEYKTDYNWLKNDIVKFQLKDENIEINAVLDKKMLQAINEKCNELGWTEK